MSNKRRNTSSPECEEPPKRLQTQSVEEDLPYDDYDSEDEVSNEKPQLDASTGQAGAFPGLGSTDETFYGPANDGIDYLRMVRSEAKGIPQLLRAQVEDSIGYDEQEADDHHGGYWDDEGTFTAAPYVAPQASQSNMPKAQIEYYQSLLTQFAVVRATMRCLPPISAVEKLTSSQPISFPAENKDARRSWRHCLKTRYPHPVQVACMDENSLLELLKFMTLKMRGLFDDQSLESIQRTGAWVWSVLGKCPDRGQLGSEEISELRQFARKAVEVRDWLQKRGTASKTSIESGIGEEDSDQELDSEGDKDMLPVIEAAKARLAQQKDTGIEAAEEIGTVQEVTKTGAAERSPLQESVVILDIIVSAVGELYGQRDLLELRQVWDDDVVQFA